MKTKKQQATEELEILLTYTDSLSFPNMWQYNPADQTKKLSPSVRERVSKFINKFVK